MLLLVLSVSLVAPDSAPQRPRMELEPESANAQCVFSSDSRMGTRYFPYSSVHTLAGAINQLPRSVQRYNVDNLV